MMPFMIHLFLSRALAADGTQSNGSSSHGESLSVGNNEFVPLLNDQQLKSCLEACDGRYSSSRECVSGASILCDPAGHLSDVRRSEERRVGKECRSRWSPYH